MKRITIIFIGLFISVISIGQNAHIEGGVSFSNLKWEIPYARQHVLDEQIVGYSVFVGLDYLDRKFFNLSSNIGMVRKGAKYIVFMDDVYGPVNGTYLSVYNLDYISLNTTFDLKLPVAGIFFPFISVGPRIDYKYDFAKAPVFIENKYDVKKFSYGLLSGAGFKFRLKDFIYGIRGDYYMNFSKIADDEPSGTLWGGTINDQTFTLQLFIGKKLE